LQNHVTPTNVDSENKKNDGNQNLQDDDMNEVDTFELYLSHSSTPTVTSNIPSVLSIETLLEQYDRIPYQSYKLDN